jgi:LPS-assembly lipoprotein
MLLNNPRQFIGCLMIGFSLVLSGCGFHLRGTGVDNVELDELQLSARNSYGQLYRDIRQALIVDGVEITNTAPFHLQLLDEQENKTAVTYTSRATPAEFELETSLTFQISDVSDRPLVGPVTLTTQRIFVNDADNLTGTSEEEALLRKEMHGDLTRQLLFRLSSLSESELSARGQALDRQNP